MKPLVNEVSRFTDLQARFRQQLRSSIERDTASWGNERAFAASFDAALAAVLQRAVDPAFQAELRFKGMDRAQPFVELSCFSCEAPAQLAELALGALAAFAPFCPRRARVGLRAADAAALAAAGLRVEADLHTLAASSRALRSRDDLPAPRLERALLARLEGEQGGMAEKLCKPITGCRLGRAPRRAEGRRHVPRRARRHDARSDADGSAPAAARLPPRDGGAARPPIHHEPPEPLPRVRSAAGAGARSSLQVGTSPSTSTSLSRVPSCRTELRTRVRRIGRLRACLGTFLQGRGMSR